MNKRVFSMAILTIISALILVLVIVYATNVKKINKLLGLETGEQTVSEETVEGEEAAASAVYGDQIGDNLNGFLLDEDFFDETEKIPSVVVVRKANSAGKSQDDAESTEDALVGDDGITGDDASASDTTGGTGMAVVGELVNPNPQLPAGYQDDATGASGYLKTVPTAPEGGFGTYIPADQTVTGTPVGNVP